MRRNKYLSPVLSCLALLVVVGLSWADDRQAKAPEEQAARDEYFTAMALELARQAAAQGDEPFGAIMVRDGQVVGRAYNSVKSEQGITRHAELNLIDQALRQWGFRYLQDCTIYASSEPCAMCSGAMLLMKLGAMVYSAPQESISKHHPAYEAVPSRHIFALGRHKVQVRGPVLREQGERIIDNHAAARKRAAAKPGP